MSRGFIPGGVLRRVLAVAATLACLAAPAVAPAVAQDTVKLTSLDWPPFSGQGQKDGGAAVSVVRAAMAAVGRKVEVEFYPWNRAVALVKGDVSYIGYFPEYDGADVRDSFVVSVPLGSSPLGLAERADAGVTWNELKDLKGKRIGVVDGYVNTEAFDAMMASGELTTDKAGNDLTNLKKLLAGRIDLAVIDQAVMDDLIRTTPELKAQAAKLRFNPKILEDKTLHIAFRKDAQGEDMAKLFAEGLSKIDAKLILRQGLGS